MKSHNSISREWNSPRTREHECLNDLISSDVLSYLVGSKDPLAGFSGSRLSESEERAGCDVEVEVAMTRKVVLSKSMTSVALHA